MGRYCPQLLADYLLLAAAPPSARSRALLHYASPAAALAASAGANAAGTVAAAAAAAEEDALAGEPLSAEAGAALRRGAYALYGACSAAEVRVEGRSSYPGQDLDCCACMLCWCSVDRLYLLLLLCHRCRFSSYTRHWPSVPPGSVAAAAAAARWPAGVRRWRP